MLSEAEAFLLAVDPGVIGGALLGRDLLARAAAAPGGEPLAEKAAFYQKAYAVAAHRAPQRLAQVEAILRREGLTAPPRPADGAAFSAWREAVVTAALARVEPHSAEGVAAAFGAALGDALVAADLLATVLALLTVAPAQPLLLGQHAGLSAHLDAARGQLELLASHPRTGAALRHAGASIVRLLPPPASLAAEGADEARAVAARQAAKQLDDARVVLERACGGGLSVGEAYRLGFVPTATGIPFEGLEIANNAERGAEPPLAARVALVAQGLRSKNPETVASVLEVEGLLDKAALPRPERPQTAEGYQTWLKEVRQNAASVAHPLSPGAAALMAGYFLAEVYEIVALGAIALTLLDAAPERPLLVGQATSLARMLPGAVTNLQKAAGHQALEPRIAAAAVEVARLAGQAPRFDDAALPPMARMMGVQAVMDQLVKLVAPLRSR